ncbi:MAG: adenylate/guanylate cyclase domain-containing protein [Acidobacteria bacterium]|nr:adenylate/guanylate cyclase domain-containing protein [Acidobacteriota bacterium]
MLYRKRVTSSASLDRLTDLIEARLAPGADKETIDQRITDLFQETWCVMFTDLAGFSRNVADFGIIHFLQTIYEAERLLTPVIEEHDGILLKVEGDSLLIIFRNPTKALEAAVAMQRSTFEYNESREPAERVLLCIGIGCGLVLRVGEDVFGAEVNAACKLGEDVAKAGEIVATERFVSSAIIDQDALEELAGLPAGIEKAYRLNYQLSKE